MVAKVKFQFSLLPISFKFNTNKPCLHLILVSTNVSEFDISIFYVKIIFLNLSILINPLSMINIQVTSFDKNVEFKLFNLSSANLKSSNEPFAAF